MKKALCIKDGFMQESNEQFCVEGKTYDVERESGYGATLVSEIGPGHVFRWRGDGEGTDFYTWFVDAETVTAEDTNAERHRAILDALHDSYKKKNHDYGDSFHKSFEKFGLISPVVRMGDKMGRLETLTQKEAQVKDESIRDTLIDLANYCIMTVMELDNKEASHE